VGVALLQRCSGRAGGVFVGGRAATVARLQGCRVAGHPAARRPHFVVACPAQPALPAPALHAQRGGHNWPGRHAVRGAASSSAAASRHARDPRPIDPPSLRHGSRWRLLQRSPLLPARRLMLPASILYLSRRQCAAAVWVWCLRLCCCVPAHCGAHRGDPGRPFSPSGLVSATAGRARLQCTARLNARVCVCRPAVPCPCWVRAAASGTRRTTRLGERGPHGLPRPLACVCCMHHLRPVRFLRFYFRVCSVCLGCCARAARATVCPPPRGGGGGRHWPLMGDCNPHADPVCFNRASSCWPLWLARGRLLRPPGTGRAPGTWHSGGQLGLDPVTVVRICDG